MAQSLGGKHCESRSAATITMAFYGVLQCKNARADSLSCGSASIYRRRRTCMTVSYDSVDGLDDNASERVGAA